MKKPKPILVISDIQIAKEANIANEIYPRSAEGIATYTFFDNHTYRCSHWSPKKPNFEWEISETGNELYFRPEQLDNQYQQPWMLFFNSDENYDDSVCKQLNMCVIALLVEAMIGLR